MSRVKLLNSNIFRVFSAPLVLIAGAVALGAIPAVATAQADGSAAPAISEEEIASRFGALRGASSVALAPDGSAISFLAPSTGQGNDLYVVSTQEGAQPRRLLRASGNPEILNWCFWKSLTRLVCEMEGREGFGPNVLGFVRFIGVDATGGNVVVLGHSGRRAMYGGGVVDWLYRDPDHILLSTAGGAVVKVNIHDNSVADTVMRGREIPTGYMSDGEGNLRVMVTSQIVADAALSNTFRYFHRTGEGDDWAPIAVNDEQVNDGFRPAHVDVAGNRIIGFLKRDGFDTVATVPLDDSGVPTTLHQRQGVEVDGIVTLGLARRFVGVSYVTERRHVEYFDSAVGAMARSLSRALGGREVVFIDQTIDASAYLLWAGSGSDPGRYYLYRPAQRQLRPLLAANPRLEGLTLSQVTPVTYPAADGTMIPGYLTLPPGRTEVRGLPGIVLPHGGPSARDEGDFDWLAQSLAHAGYAVLQPNYRGSSGYGDAWYVNNGFQSWRLAIGDVSDGGRWLLSQGADASRLSIVGWSYGGYAALQSGVVAPDLFKSIVAIAPVTDLERMRRDTTRRFNGRWVRDFIGEGPHIRAGSPAQNASAITAPVLMFHGTLDTNVVIEQGRIMHRALQEAGRQSELVEFEGLEHQLATSEARTAMLQRILGFLP